MYIYIYIYILPVMSPSFPNISCIETWSQADVPPVDHQAALQEAKKAWRSNDFVSITGQGFFSHSTGVVLCVFFCGCWTSPEKNENVFVGNDIPVGWGLGHCTNPCSREGYGQFHHLEIRFTQKEIRQGRELRHFSFIFSRLPQLTNKVLGAALINDLLGFIINFGTGPVTFLNIVGVCYNIYCSTQKNIYIINVSYIKQFETNVQWLNALIVTNVNYKHWHWL